MSRESTLSTGPVARAEHWTPRVPPPARAAIARRPVRHLRACGGGGDRAMQGRGMDNSE